MSLTAMSLTAMSSAAPARGLPARPAPFAAGAVIRRLWPSDRAALQAHFRRLDRESRFNRFLYAVGEAGAAAYAARALDTEGVVFGAFLDRGLRGVGELRPMEAGGASPDAEAAFTVEAAYRRLGLGTALAQRLTETARNGGTRRLHVHSLASNRPMRGLALKLGAEVAVAGREIHATMPLSPATPLSLWQEWVGTLFDLALTAFPPLATRPGRA